MGRGFGGRGGFGSMGDMMKLMKQAQKMQEEMMAAQEEMESAHVEATSGGGVVKAVVNGKGRLVALEIRPEVVDPDDVEMLQDLIVAAIQEAEQKAQEMAEERMQEITGGFGGLPPGLF